jgi:hypothetical protein
MEQAAALSRKRPRASALFLALKQRSKQTQFVQDVPHLVLDLLRRTTEKLCETFLTPRKLISLRANGFDRFVLV